MVKISCGVLVAIVALSVSNGIAGQDEGAKEAQKAAKRTVVVELFTSEG